MAIDTPEGHLYLGTDSDSKDPLFLEASDLTTHGVIVGMTGSGKTGLGVVMLEEALQCGVPALIIDPKGDMGNLMLTFPNLLPTDFMPWISESEAGNDVAQAAFEKASLWKSGLERSGVDASRIQKLRDTADFSIYTPGSTSGIPLNVIGSLNAPPPGTDSETLQDEIEGFVASLLALVGVSGDPLSSREHILLSNIIHFYWSQNKSLDLGMLIGLVQQPPMRKLGVIDLDSFFPPGDRVKLAMKLNGLAASPSFASWSEGPDLDIQRLLYGNGSENKPQAAIISLGHLSEEERQFVVTLLMSKMVTWMRQQPGTGDLRALIYMDEVFGYVPPVESPPSKKPILTILKQARAFGVGLVLSTQNPVDIDYKAISNAGTWMIGRLQTDRDKQRLLDGMGASDGSVDLKEVGDTISALNKREFVLHSTRSKKPKKFSTRWAMSYLAGPLTREQISQLTSDESRQSAVTIVPRIAVGGAFGEAPQQAPAALADNESAVAPQTADTVGVRYLDPSAPYAHEIGSTPEGKRLVAALAVRVHLLFDDTKAKLKHTSEWEAIITPLDGPLDADDAIIVDFDDRDFTKKEPEGAIYVLPDAKLKNKSYFTAAKRAIKAHLYRSQELELFHNPELKVFSRIGEMRDEFEDRCKIVADEKTDADANKLREMLARKVDRINAAIEKSEDKLREIQFDAESRKKDQRSNQIMDIAGGLLGSLLGGRRSTRSVITGGLRRSQSKGRMVAKSEERLKTAENRYNSLMEDREALEDELTEDLYEIQDEWEAKASAIESLIVGLEKTDITVDDATLVWIPVS
jgi:hypothetical protein